LGVLIQVNRLPTVHTHPSPYENHGCRSSAGPVSKPRASCFLERSGQRRMNPRRSSTTIPLFFSDAPIGAVKSGNNISRCARIARGAQSLVVTTLPTLHLCRHSLAKTRIGNAAPRTMPAATASDQVISTLFNTSRPAPPSASCRIQVIRVFRSRD